MVKCDSTITKRYNNQNDAVKMWRDSSVSIVTSGKQGIRLPALADIRNFCTAFLWDTLQTQPLIHCLCGVFLPRVKVAGMRS